MLTTYVNRSCIKLAFTAKTLFGGGASAAIGLYIYF